MSHAKSDPPAPEPILTLGDPAFTADPYPTLAAVRAGTGIHHDDVWGGWWVVRHADVDALLRSSDYVKDPRKAADGPYTQTLLAMGWQESMLFMDPPDHTRVRALVRQAFTPRAVETLRPRVQTIADGLLATVADREGFDVMATLASPLPTIVIAEMIGVDPEDRDRFKAWSDDMALGFDPGLAPAVRDRVTRSQEALDAYFARAITERRWAPRDDLMSRLIAAQEAGDRLTDDDMVGTLGLLLAAGNVTTTDLIGNGVFALLCHPAELEKLRRDPTLIVNAVEEMLRYDTPVVATDRLGRQPVTIAGCPVPAGEWLWPVAAAANHDPAVFPDPERFDIAREHVDHLSFGAGPHFCLGAALARLEAQVAIATLVRRFPRLRLVLGVEPRRKIVPGFRGLVSLPVLVS